MEELPNRIPSYCTSIPTIIKDHDSSRRPIALHQPKYSEGLPREYSLIAFSVDKVAAQRRAAPGINKMTEEFEHNAVRDHSKYAKECMNVYRKYTITHIAAHGGNGVNMRYFLETYAYTTANDNTKPSVEIPSHFIMQLLQKMQTKTIKARKMQSKANS